MAKKPSGQRGLKVKLQKDGLSIDLGPSTLKFAKRVFGVLAEGGDFLSDRVRFYRWKSLVDMLKEAKEYAAKSRVDPREIPLKLAIPLLEKASLEPEGSDLTKRWAALLTNLSANPAARYGMYIHILGEIDSEEARVLSVMFGNASAREIFRPENFGGESGITIQKDNDGKEIVSIDWMNPDIHGAARFHIRYEWHEDDIPNTNEFTFDGFDTSLQLMHLKSLGLVEMGSGLLEHVDKKRSFVLYARLTPLGFDFIRMCQPPEEA